MSTSLTPDQATALIRAIPLNAPIAEVFLSGFYLCLVLLSVGIIWTSKRADSHKWFWMGLVLLLYILAMIHGTLEWYVTMEPLQDYGGSPQVIAALKTPPNRLEIKILGLLASALLYIITDCIMIWRCWVVWGRSRLVPIPAILAQVAGTVCAGLGIAGQISLLLMQHPLPGEGLGPLVRFSTPFLSISLAVTLYTTGMISWRIISVQRNTEKDGSGRTSDLSTALEILVESSALYAASIFAFVVLLAMKSTKQAYMQDIHTPIAGIAPTLLITRIFVGHARKDSEWRNASRSSSLQFRSQPGQPTGSTATSLTFHRAATEIASSSDLLQTLMSVTDARLPRELEHEIFEYTAYLYPETIPSLLCVAHRVRVWCDRANRIPYNPNQQIQALLILPAATKSKPPEFFAKHVQRIFIDSERTSEPVKDVCAALALCINVTRIAGVHASLSRLLLPVIIPMRLERIALFLTDIFPESIWAVDLGLSCFQTLTHFDVFDFMSDEGEALVYATKLCALPVLTHLSLNDMVPWEAVETLFQGCRCLEILVVQWSEYVEVGKERAAQAPFDDMRFLMTPYVRMDESVLDPPNLWSLAEAFIADKRRGNIDSRCFWMTRDEDEDVDDDEDEDDEEELLVETSSLDSDS
ncbi:hypothetical protein C8F01DRAFT_1366563 [Mycena amicta]|nr:hypothetical protein C8F01DRAFT_1366563 [Mycena amicta]